MTLPGQHFRTHRPTDDDLVGLRTIFLHVIQWVLVRSTCVRVWGEMDMVMIWLTKVTLTFIRIHVCIFVLCGDCRERHKIDKIIEYFYTVPNPLCAFIEWPFMEWVKHIHTNNWGTEPKSMMQYWLLVSNFHQTSCYVKFSMPLGILFSASLQTPVCIWLHSTGMNHYNLQVKYTFPLFQCTCTQYSELCILVITPTPKI